MSGTRKMEEFQRMGEIMEAYDAAPTFYVLRRTVGKTTMHYEYWDREISEWSVYIEDCLIREEKYAEINKRQNLLTCNIIPIRLIEGEV